MICSLTEKQLDQHTVYYLRSYDLQRGVVEEHHVNKFTLMSYIEQGNHVHPINKKRMCKEQIDTIAFTCHKPPDYATFVLNGSAFALSQIEHVLRMLYYACALKMLFSNSDLLSAFNSYFTYTMIISLGFSCARTAFHTWQQAIRFSKTPSPFYTSHFTRVLFSQRPINHSELHKLAVEFVGQ